MIDPVCNKNPLKFLCPCWTSCFDIYFHLALRELPSQIVYRKPDLNDQTHHVRATIQLQSKSQPVVLARFRLNEFNHMALEDRLDMLIQLQSGKQSSTATKEDSIAPLWEFLTTLLIHYCGSSFSERFTQLITFCLWRMVVVQGLSAIQCVLDAQTMGLGPTTELYGVITQHWWSEKDSWTSIPGANYFRSCPNSRYSVTIFHTVASCIHMLM